MLFFVLLVIVLLSLHQANSTVTFGSYAQIPGSPSGIKFGADLEFYRPSRNPASSSLWYTYTGSNGGIYVSLFSNTSSISPIRIGSATTNYRPGIRQLSMFSNSGMIIAWTSSTTSRITASIFTPSVAGDGTGTYTTPEELQYNNSNSDIILYLYAYASPSIEMYFNDIYFSNAFILTGSTTPPPPPGTLGVAISTDGGNTIIIGPSVNNLYTSSKIYGPQFALYAGLFFIQYVPDTYPFMSYVGWGYQHVPQLGQLYPLTYSPVYYTTPGFCAGTSNTIFVTIYQDKTSQIQYSYYFNFTTDTWVYLGQAYTFIPSSAVALRYDNVGSFGGYGLASGTDGSLYYETFAIIDY